MRAILYLIILLVLPVSGCSKFEESKIVGKWHNDYKQTVIVFNSDHSGYIDSKPELIDTGYSYTLAPKTPPMKTSWKLISNHRIEIEDYYTHAEFAVGEIRDGHIYILSERLTKEEQKK